MPGGDRTGPRGLGSRTGRGMGYCAGYSTPGYMNVPGRGYGYGYGRGMAWRRGGRGWGWRGYVPPEPVVIPQHVVRPIYYPSTSPTPVDQLTMLKQEKEYLESEMTQIKNAVDEISKKIEELDKEE